MQNKFMIFYLETKTISPYIWMEYPYYEKMLWIFS